MTTPINSNYTQLFCSINLEHSVKANVLLDKFSKCGCKKLTHLYIFDLRIISTMDELNDNHIRESTCSDNDSIKAIYEYKLENTYNPMVFMPRAETSSSSSSIISVNSNKKGRAYYFGIVKPENYNSVVFFRNDYGINCELTVYFISSTEPLKLLWYDDKQLTYTVSYENDTFSVIIDTHRAFIDTFQERLSFLEG